MSVGFLSAIIRVVISLGVTYLGAVIDAIMVIIGTGIGLLFRKGIPDRVADTVQSGLGLVAIILGIHGALASSNPIILVVSIALGAVVGESLGIDQGINRAAAALQTRFSKPGKTNLVEGFIAGTSLFCVGSLVIVGSLENGLLGDPTTLLTKSALDAISAVFLTASFGVGVGLAAISVLVIEGGIIIFSRLLAPILSETVITEIVAVGSLLLLALGLNLSGATKFRVMNYTPAIIFPVILLPLLHAFF